VPGGFGGFAFDFNCGQSNGAGTLKFRSKGLATSAQLGLAPGFPVSWPVVQIFDAATFGFIDFCESGFIVPR